ncbi:hypothetical protein ACO0LO_16755 [Undibacterium sp. TJN25]|uniref:hypothetical protein n=1 Tax=Undibacterium sp. TJN25 TaxID=3413056 RepID=UPI003BF31958
MHRMRDTKKSAKKPSRRYSPAGWLFNVSLERRKEGKIRPAEVHANDVEGGFRKEGRLREWILGGSPHAARMDAGFRPASVSYALAYSR